MFEINVNFEAIQNRLDSCRSMHDSGKKDKAKAMLIELAEDIIEESHNE